VYNILEGIDEEKSDEIKLEIRTIMTREMRIINSEYSPLEKDWRAYLTTYGNVINITIDRIHSGESNIFLQGLDMIKTPQLKALIRRGVPNNLRRNIYMFLATCNLAN